MLLGTHRVAATTSNQCNRLYLRKKIKRTTPVGDDERAARMRFAAVARAVNTRAKDLSNVTADQAAFLAQKDSPYGKKTMKSYLWMLEGEIYDESQN